MKDVIENALGQCRKADVLTSFAIKVVCTKARSRQAIEGPALASSSTNCIDFHATIRRKFYEAHDNGSNIVS